MSKPKPDKDAAKPKSERIVSIDAARGFTMLVMIFVNDLSDVSNDIVPPWMKHFRGDNGMTFVDLVFPAFLFIVGMSIPFALGGRISRGEPIWRTLLHVLARTLSLLFIGVMMVNGTPATDKMGWSGALWETLMFVCAIFAFCDLAPVSASEKSKKIFRVTSFILRVAGLAALIYLAFVFRNKNGKPMSTLSPFYIHHIWYGILGYIGWAYLCGSIVFLIFRTNLTGILGCAVLMMCLYPANLAKMFDSFWIAHHVNIGVALGSRAAITTLGVLLGAMLTMPTKRNVGPRVEFTSLFILGCAAAALLLNPLYGISKDNATPSWAIWGCVVTSVLWLVFYFVCDVQPIGFISKPFAIAGRNVLLAYLISEMLPSLIDVLGLHDIYANLASTDLTAAIVRSSLCSVIILLLATGLNRIGFRLRL